MLLEFTGVEILVELFFFSFVVSKDGVSGTGFLFIIDGLSDGRHGVFVIEILCLSRRENAKYIINESGEF